MLIVLFCACTRVSVITLWAQTRLPKAYRGCKRYRYKGNIDYTQPYTSFFTPTLIAPVCAVLRLHRASALYFERKHTYLRCRGGVKGTDIREISITPNIHLFLYAYADYTSLRRFAPAPRLRIVLRAQTRIPGLQRGCKGCRYNRYIDYTNVHLFVYAYTDCAVLRLHRPHLALWAQTRVPLYLRS